MRSEVNCTWGFELEEKAERYEGLKPEAGNASKKYAVISELSQAASVSAAARNISVQSRII